MMHTILSRTGVSGVRTNCVMGGPLLRATVHLRAAQGCDGLLRAASRHRSSRVALSAAAPSKPPFFVTTPIYYVNGVPHIGHAYTSLTCDVIARFKRLDGHDVHFLTGTDEHGQKVEQSANAAGETPQAFADRVSATFRELIPAYSLSADQFIRTTDASHKKAAQALWLKLLVAGDIYLDAYEGWYSVRDEAFYTEAELVDGVAPTGAPVEWVAESSYFFRLSSYKERLEEYINDNPEFIQPASRRNEVLAFMRDGLRDLSISRTTFGWGVPVPADPAQPDSTDNDGHVMYVWLDALANYISALGYPDVDGEQFSKFWPASLHMVGKDILRFHAIYWPAFLMAAGLPLPARLFAHGWWTKDGQKMSKSVGNTIDPIALVEQYGCDQVRYFMVNEVSFGGDGDFSHTAMVNCINAKLSNDLGNLAYRTLAFAYKHCEQTVPEPAVLQPADHEMLEAARGLLPSVRALVDELGLHRVTQQTNAVVQQANRYIDTQAPWSLRKSDPERMRTVLWVLMETLRHVGTLSLPVTPTIAAALLDQLAVPAKARTFAALEEGSGCEVKGGVPLPEPSVIIPRYELKADEEEGASAMSASAAPEPQPVLEGEALSQLEEQVRAQGDAVRVLKISGGDQEALAEAVATLLALKTQLPDGHELKGGGKKKKKKKNTAAA